MNLTRTVIPVGLEKPLRVLHITDTHLPLYGENDTPEMIASGKRRGAPGDIIVALKEQMNYAEKNCDLILHTGDLIDFASEPNFEFLRSFLRNEKVLFIAGNHEYWRCDGGFEDMAYRQNSIRLMGMPGADLMFTSRIAGGINFVGIDDAYHQVEPFQTERLREEVKKGLPGGAVYARSSL